MPPDRKQPEHTPTAVDQLRDATHQAGQAFDDGLHTAADAVKSGTASANRAYGRAQDRAGVSISCKPQLQIWHSSYD